MHLVWASGLGPTSSAVSGLRPPPGYDAALGGIHAAAFWKSKNLGIPVSETSSRLSQQAL